MRSWALPALLICCLALTACGGENKRDLGPQNLPLTKGARVSAKVRVCDKGANAYCAEQLIVVGGDYPTSADLLNAENAYLRKLGWTVSRGNTGKQLAAQSPGNELRVTYDTAYNDLLAIESGWIRRSAPYGRALSSTLFDRDSAIAVELLRGSS